MFASWMRFCERAGEHPGTRKQFVGALAGRDGILPA